jgi:hypothetical protein
VHGSVGGGESTWAEQRPLAERFALIVVDRPGYVGTPMVEREDFEEDAPLVAEALGDVRTSSAIRTVESSRSWRPPSGLRNVRSLTVVEPPAFGVARDHPAVRELVDALARHWDAGERDPEAFLRRFLELVGSDMRPPSPLPPELERGARVLLVERPPWEAEIPVDALAAAPFPKLVVSGGASRGLRCGLRPARRAPGGRTGSYPRRGPFRAAHGKALNERLERFLPAG